MSCEICKKVKGKPISHADGVCPTAPSLLCRRCHHRGHLTSMCKGDLPHWERPTTLEELIPADIRQRLNIRTHTHLEFTAPRGSVNTYDELGAINEIIIPDNYSALKEFMDTHKIKVLEKVTKEKMENRIKAVIEWAAARGLRITMKSEMPAT